MVRIFSFSILPILLLLFGQSSQPISHITQHTDTLKYKEEIHLKNVRQLTFGGDNAEAYWSFNSKKLTFQSNNPSWNLKCDQIFVTAVDGVDLKNKIPQRISNGEGRTTCSYFLPGDSLILF